MFKINIYFASADSDYLKSVEKYILGNCKNINAAFFSNAHNLDESLKSARSKVDIVLVDEDVYDKLSEGEKASILVVLAEDLSTCILSDVKIISKYQPGEKLIACINDIYKETYSGKFIDMTSKGGHSKLIGVYSPIGGAGKTTVAAMSSIIASHLGKKVFYLNLENISSTNTFFRGRNDENISKLIYFLKRKDRETVQQKMTIIWSLDSKYGVYYFSPPNNIADVGELKVNEIEKLFEALTLCELFDYIFVDFSSEFDNDKKTLLRKCNKILWLFTHDEVSVSRMELLNRDLNSVADEEIITEKSIVVLNKYNGKYKLPIEQSKVSDRQVSIFLPYEPSLSYYTYDEFQVNNKNDFQAAIAGLVNML